MGDPVMIWAKTMVAMTAICLPLVIVWLVLRYRAQRDTMRSAVFREYVAAGQAVPPEFLNPPDVGHSSDLRMGLGLVGLGIGLAAVMLQLGEAWTFGLLPGFVGVAYLITWAVRRRDEA